LIALKEMLGAAGLGHPRELGPEHVIRRVSATEVRSLAALHHWARPGELLSGVAGPSGVQGVLGRRARRQLRGAFDHAEPARRKNALKPTGLESTAS
jgi:hypothetical protein